jgi:DNA-binding transcriptional regulator/RsmH inhibitor MraZ
MIRNKRKLDEFYRKLDAKEKLSYKKALRIYDALHKEAVALGAISHENIWDGFEVDLRIARAINGLGRGRKANKKSISKVRRK